MELKELKNKKILILGFGKEGKDNYLGLRKLFPNKVLGVADRVKFLIKKDKFLKLHFGKNYLQALKNYEIIIKTPGISLETIKPYLRKQQKITSQTEIFLENCPGKIIGVTGTKGKGTTASLIYQILKKTGFNARLIGNIGQPVFQILLKSKKDDVFVYEMSSHQLKNLKKSPHIAVFLNLYPAHLDYYKTFKKYQSAKENITLHQSKEDFFIYNSDQKELRALAKKTKSKKISFNVKKLRQLEKTISKKEIPLKGDFNLLNILAAILTAEVLGISKKIIRKAIKEFKPLPHRLEFVGKYQGISFYNDSLATIPQAVEVGLTALGKNVKTLIIGGMKVKNIGFACLAKKISASSIKTLILFPDTGKEIWAYLNKKRGEINAFFTCSMKKAVQYAYQNTKKGEICLLSPGSPSQNLFKDYKEKGNLFKHFVKLYGTKKTS